MAKAYAIPVAAAHLPPLFAAPEIAVAFVPATMELTVTVIVASVSPVTQAVAPVSLAVARDKAAAMGRVLLSILHKTAAPVAPPAQGRRLPAVVATAKT